VTSASDRQLNLSLTTTPTTHTLASVMAVLHSRAADVQHLTWSTSRDRSNASIALQVTIDHRRHSHLCAALRRVIGVTSVESDREQSLAS
jgi:acetolactate synthase regulatory subunit